MESSNILTTTVILTTLHLGCSESIYSLFSNNLVHWNPFDNLQIPLETTQSHGFGNSQIPLEKSQIDGFGNPQIFFETTQTHGFGNPPIPLENSLINGFENLQIPFQKSHKHGFSNLQIPLEKSQINGFGNPKIPLETTQSNGFSNPPIPLEKAQINGFQNPQIPFEKSQEHSFGNLQIPFEKSQGHSSGNTRIPLETTVLNGGEYDFIVVGSGPAGSVITNRLSEIGNWKILLLEAGLPSNVLAVFPPLQPLLQLTEYSWGDSTEPEHHGCLAMKEKRCTWPTGKALGGSSVINGLFYTRGHPEDYDYWEAQGNLGWSYADILPYFLKSEDAHLNKSDAHYHRQGGYLSVVDAYISELGNAFISAGKEIGYKLVDHNSPNLTGFGRVQVNTKQGRRQSAADAFLIPILHRKNLEILTEAMVTKVLINPFKKKAYGVEYKWRNKQYRATVRKEVILSAGPFGSPQLLMLSGIGPKKHLEELGIPTITDLPVGKNLNDHPGMLGLVITTNLTTMSPSFDPVQVLQWYKTGEGPLSSTSGIEAIAYLKTGISKEQAPDIELLLRLTSIVTDRGTIEGPLLGLPQEYYNKMYASLESNVTFTIVPILLHPKSTGHMKLRSSNPYDRPLLYADYFSDPDHEDIQTMIAGIRVIMKLLETKTFRKYNAQLSRKPFVGCEKLAFDSDEHWECALRLMASSLHHHSATCRMGPHDDPKSVVNHELKVYGISKIRVADASIIPRLNSGHTAAVSYMIGEKAADLIKEDWGILQS